MDWGKKLSVVQMIMCVVIAVGYGIDGDWRRVVYWLSAACITASLTF